ncbi:hypothetical protein J6590_089712 [Homalodisca vitripennis]|nr:hypothetical protein J6590_089712 [Homalodisca vitripennis]
MSELNTEHKALMRTLITVKYETYRCNSLQAEWAKFKRKRLFWADAIPYWSAGKALTTVGYRTVCCPEAHYKAELGVPGARIAEDIIRLD